MVVGMNNTTSTSRVAGLTSFIRVLRGFAEASLVALGFVLAILLIGAPLALLARGVHEALSWLVALRGETSALMEAVVSVSSVVGTVILVGVLVRLLVGFFRWRRRYRGRVISGRTAKTGLDPHEIAGAAHLQVPQLATAKSVHVTRRESGTEAAARHEPRARDRVIEQAPRAWWMSIGAAAR
jgi:hypothetical protein